MELIKQFSPKRNFYRSICVFKHADLTVIAATASESVFVHIAPARTNVRAYAGAYWLSDCMDTDAIVATVAVVYDQPKRKMPGNIRVKGFGRFLDEVAGPTFPNYKTIPLPADLAVLNPTPAFVLSILDAVLPDTPHTYRAISDAAHAASTARVEWERSIGLKGV